MMPHGFRNRSEHVNPSKAFLYTLGALVNIGGEDHPSLSELHVLLIAACNQRRWGVIDAKDGRYIMLSDLNYAVKVRRSVLKSIAEESKDGSDVDECLRQEVAWLPDGIRRAGMGADSYSAEAVHGDRVSN